MVSLGERGGVWSGIIAEGRSIGLEGSIVLGKSAVSEIVATVAAQTAKNNEDEYCSNIMVRVVEGFGRRLIKVGMMLLRRKSVKLDTVESLWEG